MKFAKRITAVCLTLALCVSPALAAGVEDRFPSTQPYPGFADVPAGSWFEPAAIIGSETGLILGSNLGFEPYREMTVGECAVIAARIRQAAMGEPFLYVDPKPGETRPWYFPYVEYLESHGVQGLEQPESNASRAGFLSLLNAVLTPELLSPINQITSLPDSTDAAVLTFYNAGILSGIDKYGTFDGHKPLTRAEGATMVSRVVRDGLRKSFVPADYSAFTAAEVKPGDVFFEGGVTAERYLDAVLTHIATLETSCKTQGIEFNWFSTVGEQSFLEYVKAQALLDLGVDKKAGTDLFTSFDLQVFYSRYIDIKGLAT